jgi:hypothetical protein
MSGIWQQPEQNLRRMSQFVLIREIGVSKSKTAGPREEPGRCELSRLAL